MLTTSFKTWGAYGIVAYFAAVVYGYSSGGNSVGPISLGWLGGVGDHVGYGILLGLSACCLMIGLVFTAFRDSDAEMAASYMQSAAIPAAQPPVGNSVWPVATGLGLGTVILGLAVHPAVFAVGAAILGLIALEWTMEAWADRATGDPDANRELRDRIMGPIELPMMAAVGVTVLALSISRILLAVSIAGSVIVASLLALIIFGGATFLAIGPELNRKMVNGMLALGLVGVVGAGIVSAVIGEREIEHHDEHGEDEEHGDDHSDEESLIVIDYAESGS